MPHGEVIGGRGKGRHPGPSDDLIFLNSRCFVLLLEYSRET